jgi:hypothetical protein
MDRLALVVEAVVEAVGHTWKIITSPDMGRC